ncbi:MAG: class I tRNA ligase family protein, partial [Oscillospiraceae bacterium]|nr:class I tRNA ligase family protein [Oscillospiraceae bacterium]
YRVDVRCSDPIFKQLSDVYLKIRNTARYILGNIWDFDPDEPVAYEQLLPEDKWALARLGKLIDRCIAAIDDYEFHTVIHAIHNFCVVDMSNFYLDIIKDRLYCERADSVERRAGQTAMFRILDSLVRLLAPLLAFTSNEIWQAMPHRKGDNPEHIVLNDMAKSDPAWALDENEDSRWESALRLRDDVNKALELARGQKVIGKPLDAKVTLYVGDEAKAEFERIADRDFKVLCIVSRFDVVYGQGEGYRGERFPGVTVSVENYDAPKCVRCWTKDEGVGQDHEHPELCPRCAAAVK